MATVGRAKEAADVSTWRKVLELGRGRAGSVALYAEQVPPGSSMGQSRVLHAVKRVERKRCMASDGLARRVLREKNVLQALRGVRKGHAKNNARLKSRTGVSKGRRHAPRGHSFRRERHTGTHSTKRFHPLLL